MTTSERCWEVNRHSARPVSVSHSVNWCLAEAMAVVASNIWGARPHGERDSASL